MKTNIDLESTNRRFYLIFFSVFGAILFLRLFQPFGVYYSDTNDPKEIFFEVIVAVLITFFVLNLSQFLLRNLLGIKKFTPISLVLWFALESVLVGSVWFFIDYKDTGIKIDPITDLIENILAYIIIMVIPYFAFVAFIQIQDLLAIAEVKTPPEEMPESPNQPINTDVAFTDESGITRLLVKLENVLFIQSSDNYVDVHYLENEKPTKFLLRNTIKNLEDKMENTALVRCHRSYMINTDKIEVAKKTPSGFNITLKQVPNHTIPVSKSYSSEISKTL